MNRGEGDCEREGVLDLTPLYAVDTRCGMHSTVRNSAPFRRRNLESSPLVHDVLQSLEGSVTASASHRTENMLRRCISSKENICILHDWFYPTYPNPFYPIWRHFSVRGRPTCHCCRVRLSMLKPCTVAFIKKMFEFLVAFLLLLCVSRDPRSEPLQLHLQF